MTEGHALEQHFGLKGKVAIVTGAAGGLGKAVAAAYVAAGAKVVLADLRQAELAAAIDDFSGLRQRHAGRGRRDQA